MSVTNRLGSVPGRVLDHPVIRWTTPALGVLVAVAVVAVATAVGDSLVESVLYASMPLAASTVVVLVGARVAATGEVFPAIQVFAWTLGGLLLLTVVGGWFAFMSSVGDGPPPKVMFDVSTLSVGALLGCGVGWGNAKARAELERRHRAEREHVTQREESRELLDSLLRHHLLNRLNVVIGYVDMLEDHVDEEGREYLDGIRRQSLDMVETIESIRDVTRTVLADLETRPVDLAPVIEQEVETARRTFPDATVTLGSVPDVAVDADDLLGPILANVLNNAVQHNDAAEPTVTVDVEVSDDEAVVSVADDGPGVPDEQKARIFGESVRGPESAGSGLGLFVTETVLDSYGGRAWIEDNEPGGAVVCVAVPLAEPAA